MAEHGKGGTELCCEVRASHRLPVGICAQDALSAVACTLSLELGGPSDGAAWEDMPPSIRGMVRPCVLHGSGSNADSRSFVERVAEHLDASRREAEDAVRAVFTAVRRRVAPPQADRIGRNLPPEVLALWGA